MPPGSRLAWREQAGASTVGLEAYTLTCHSEGAQPTTLVQCGRKALRQAAAEVAGRGFSKWASARVALPRAAAAADDGGGAPAARSACCATQRAHRRRRRRNLDRGLAVAGPAPGRLSRR